MNNKHVNWLNICLSIIWLRNLSDAFSLFCDYYVMDMYLQNVVSFKTAQR